MRYIDINKFEQAAQAINWNQIKQSHINKLRGLTPNQRRTYINENPEWNMLQPAMLSLSFNKCWYSEAPIGNGDLEIDHFRPKNKAKNKVDYKDPNSKSIITKKNGYWWKAYDCDNYRLSGALSNKRRRDRLGDCKDIKGKGEYFPLDLKNGRIAADEENLGCEVSVLLDPINRVDVCLLTFDKGIPIPASEDDYERERVYQSIYYYHLDLDQLNTDRKIVWDDCVEHIQDAKTAIDNSQNYFEKKGMMLKCFKELAKLVNPELRNFTSTARACLMVYSELDGYIWLKNFVRTL